MTVRTRIAPSPTGDPHVGTAYIALFNYAFAKQHGGQFVLRIEDTDQKRSTAESEQAILDALRWTGLDWDEGPDVGGDFGPYRQSERREHYETHCQSLIDAGHAFHCFCTSEELDAMRAEQMAAKQTPRYDGRCTHLTPDEVSKRLAEGREHVIRMRVPTEGDCVVRDRLRGDIQIPWAQVDMQVLMKADGLPTYHLANVVDDHLMGITHVIRGEEWIPSAPKHQLLYQYFGWEMPELCHLPLLRNPDQSKLSKRKNPTSILFYRDQGFLPEALLNYLGRMGWSMPDEREQFSLEEMVEAFNIDRVSLGGPIFDLDKLTWLNGQWLKNTLTDAEYRVRLMEWMCSDAFFASALPHLKSRIDVFSEASQWLNPLWVNDVSLTQEALTELGLETDVVANVLQYLIWRLESVSTWTRDAVEAEIRWVADSLGLKLKDVMPLVFLVLSGTRQAISAFDLAVLLGPNRTRARVRAGLEAVGGVSKKGLKRLEKSYQEALQSIDTAKDAN
jgi:glutamyl-tRNA synthetase